MKILTGEQMVKWDRLSIKKHGISARSLMQRAALACCDTLTHLTPWVFQAKVLIACGPGNNGGDGLAMAGILRARGVEVSLFFFGDPQKLSPEARYFFNRVQGNLKAVAGRTDLQALKSAARDADFVIDALFGTGLTRPLTGLYAEAVEILNRTKGFHLAVDMPSGIQATTGQVLGKAFRADLTVTFEAPKWGQLKAPGWDFVGKLRVVPIGLSRVELKGIPASSEFLVEEEVRPFFKERSPDTNKGRAGKVLVVAGSASMPGAGYLTSIAALRAGAGLVTWALPEEAFHRIDLSYPEVILDPIPSEDGKFHPKGLKSLLKILPKFQAVAIGPGWGQGGEVSRFLEALLAKNKRPMVIDADALNLLAGIKKYPKNISGSIWTPHPLEMSRLTGIPLAKILENRVEVAHRFARKNRIWLVLKGYRSIIAGPSGEVFVNSTGGPNLATAGSGDVLTGIIAGLLAQGLSRRQAVLGGVFLHGKAGDRLAETHGDRGTLASDIPKILPELIRGLIR